MGGRRRGAARTLGPFFNSRRRRPTRIGTKLPTRVHGSTFFCTSSHVSCTGSDLLPARRIKRHDLPPRGSARRIDRTPSGTMKKKIRTRSVSNKNVPTFGCGERLVGRERLTKFNPPAPRQPLILPIRDALRQSNGVSGARRGMSVAIIVSREEEVAAWEKEAPDRCPWFWQLQHHSIPCMHADIDCCMPLAIELK